jgi:predicted DNA-binding transcriptional regulator YafY
VNRLERFYKIHDLLRHTRHPVPIRRMQDDMEVTRNVIKKDITYLRDHFRAPIEYSKEHNGYYYAPDAGVFELPGLWFSATELHALLVCQKMLEGLQFDVIEDHMQPLKERIQELLDAGGKGGGDISDKVTVQPVHYRSVNSAHFQTVADALMAERQLQFSYQARSKNQLSQRRVSPQRLLHYRDNWYLLGWCHSAEDLRLFSLDNIDTPAVHEQNAKPLISEQLQLDTEGSFGIFLGPPQHHAKLRFTAHAAQWVADEHWHPDQHGEWQHDHYHLTVPYANPTELIKEILRHGDDVEVLAPQELRDAVAEKLKQAAQQYGG